MFLKLFRRRMECTNCGAKYYTWNESCRVCCRSDTIEVRRDIKEELRMPVPYTNMEDIIYCHNPELANEIFEFLRQKGYPVGLSVSVIQTGTHGEQVVKKLDVYKKGKEGQ